MNEKQSSKTEHLGIAFGGLKAVNDFNLEILQGELVGLIGPNGSGKTTVFNMLTGVYIPTEGEIYLRGKRITGMKTYKIVEQGDCPDVSEYPFVFRNVRD